MSPEARSGDCGRLGLGLGINDVGLGINGLSLVLVSDGLTNTSVLESKVLVSVSDS